MHNDPGLTFTVLLIYIDDVCLSFGMRPIAISWAIRCEQQLLRLEKLLIHGLARPLRLSQL